MKYDINKLNSWLSDSESCDSALYAEQRSNILLVTGNHYQKKTSKYLERLRTSVDITNEAKIRLTKNHTSKIVKVYENAISNEAPMVMIAPRNESDMDDQKNAELWQSVWQYIVEDDCLRDRIVSELIPDYVEIGECTVKIWWNPNKGVNIPVSEKIDPVTGQLTVTEMMSGKLELERIFGWDLRRTAGARSWMDSQIVGYVKMADKNELELMYADDEEKLAMVKESGKQQYIIFDNTTGQYDTNNKKVCIREYYIRPCLEYPNGYFYITTEYGILEEGELPAGVFPIKYIGFDRIPTSARSQSIIKQLRPYQAEINRAASKMAEHQVTIGDDKILIPMGTKIARGNQFDGIRAIQYQGTPPEILAGRDGSQYLQYMNSQIDEMYGVASVNEIDEDKSSGQMDAYNILFRSMREKKRFSKYAEKFEWFLREVCMDSLKLFRFHAPDQLIIPVLGKNETINAGMLKGAEPLTFQIKVAPRGDDIETMFGKQLALNQALQYVGAQLSPDMIGQVLRAMPFANKDQALEDLTLNYENARNIMLALDKGRYIPPRKYEDHNYIIKKLSQRMGQLRFTSMPEFVQQLYAQVLSEHEQMFAQEQMAIQEASMGYIPTGGALIAVDFYVNYDQQDPNKTRRARVPFEAMNWLIERLAKQGMTQDNMAMMSQGVQADVANIQTQQMSVDGMGQNGSDLMANMGGQQAPEGTYGY